MSKYAEASASVGHTAPPSRPNGLCCVNGCMRLGSLSESTTGSTDWFCGLHFRVAYSQQAAITVRANSRDVLYRAAWRLLNATTNASVPDLARPFLKRYGREDLLTGAKHPIAGRSLTARALGKHMLLVLDRECTVEPKVEQGELSIPKQPTETWRDMRSIVRFDDLMEAA